MAERWVFDLPRDSYVAATALGKPIPACVRNIV